MRIRALPGGMAAFCAASLILFSLAHSAKAQSVCKGLVQAECSANAACGWVKGFTTKTGRQVSAFCRKKPARNKTALAETGSH